ncbi:hypothetical protein BLA60_41655, partial [Actinophytocola xinjiangensis]
AGGWSVDPEHVREFARAVEAVRADLAAITREVEELSTPNYAPLLGTSPVGQQMADKFTDRMGSESGLRGQLNVALLRMEEFVASAEHTAARYLATDEDNATGLRYT